MTTNASVEMIDATNLGIFLFQAGLLLLAAVLLGRLARRLGLSAVAGELCAGILLGPTLLQHVPPDVRDWLLASDADQMHLLDAIGLVGVLLLVGLTGTQLDLQLVRRRGMTAVRVSFTGLLVPVSLGVLVGLVMPGTLIPAAVDRGTFALFLAAAMGASAIPVIAKILAEMRLIHRNVGQLILCAATVDDIVGWVLLSVVSAMATSGVRAGDLMLSLGALLAVAVIGVLVRPVVRAGLRAAERSDRATNDGVTLALVTVLMILAAAATHALGLEAVFGAFVCGILIRACGVVEHSRLAPLRTTVMAFLAPMFFATAGLRIDLAALARPVVLLSGLGVLAAAVVGKFVGAYLGARLSRLGHWEGLALGAGMNVRGVVGIVIAAVGLRLGVLSVEAYTILILVAIGTSMMAPPLLRLTMARIEQTADERLREQMYGIPVRDPDVAT